MKKTIHYGAQFIFKNDINFIKKSLQKNLITTGPYVKHFEDSIKSFLKVKYVSACSSGTSALHLVFMAIDLNKEDNIIKLVHLKINYSDKNNKIEYLQKLNQIESNIQQLSNNINSLNQTIIDKEISSKD